MYKVLIVDDELLVRVGLKTSIKWEENGFSVIGEARNGKEAIEVFNRETPDILITDVCMPQMTGLELIQKVRTRHHKVKSIILTHYDDFNYAQEAINLGVIGYLLKSNLTQDSILEYLRKAADEIGNPGPPEPGSSPADTQFKLNSPDLNDLHLLKDDYFPYRNFLAANMMFHQQNSDPALPATGITRFDEIISSISNEFFKDYEMTVNCTYKDGRMIYLFNIPDSQEIVLNRSKLKVLISSLKNTIKTYLNISISIGISRMNESMSSIPALLKEAETACSFCFFEDDNIAFFDNIAAGEIDGMDLGRLSKLLARRDSDKLGSFIKTRFALIKNSKNFGSLNSDIDVFLQSLLDLMADIKAPDGFNIRQLLTEGNIYKNFSNINALELYITDLYREIISSSSENSRLHPNSHLIQKSMKYISDHSEQNISLSTVAEYVEVSKSYLSFLFKQELGVNFTTYLTEIRIRNAQKLLLNSNMKIYEIAEDVGFDSPYYFSKVFKEQTGLTCKEYRNKYYSLV